MKLNIRSADDLALVRTRLGLTQKDVASKMFLTKHQASDIERGATRPNGASTILYGIVLEGICKERGTTFDEVLNKEAIVSR